MENAYALGPDICTTSLPIASVFLSNDANYYYYFFLFEK